MKLQTRIFDGRGNALKKLAHLKKKVAALGKSDITPRLVSIVVGDSEGALSYQKLKQKKAEETGIDLEIKQFSKRVKLYEIQEFINRLNNDPTVHGIMIQLPLPLKFTVEDRDELINMIDPYKDVDGMRDESAFLAPVVLAIESALKEALAIVRPPLKDSPLKLSILILGSRGFVGNKTFTYLKAQGFKVRGVDIGDFSMEKKFRHSDVVISCVGRPHMVTRQMVLPDQILIDIGAPVGDVDTDCYDEVAFVTPVPGGIGPVTIAFLMENVYTSVK